MDHESAEDLKALKREWYQQARDDGSLGAIATVGRTLGQELNARYGPKYRWARDGVHIYVDDYGHYLTVHVGADSAFNGGREVCSTHPCSQLFVPGAWMDTIRAQLPEARRLIAERAARHEADETRRLRAELGLD